ncbi:MAG: hypothetical protein FWH29_03105 [Methanobrevibacter sp.]|nr:hypothetical protein [Methanobrevibacter sp.]
MLNDKRIEEANINVKSYINEGLLKKVDCNVGIVETFTKKSDESLEVANFLFEENISNLWVVVTSYYSMYYIAKLF